MKNILLILASVSLNASAQILMRKGMLRIGEVSVSSSLLKALPSMLTNIFLWLSLLCYGISVFTWMIVLSKVEVSFAYAFLSLGFVFVAVISYFIFHENISAIRIAGILLVCIGVFLVSKS